MTDIDVYQPATGISQHQAGIVMTPEDAKALDDQLTQCIRAILHEGTDYGVIPGTGGDKSLWRPGAQKLLLWFGLGFTCDQIGDVERDDDAASSASPTAPSSPGAPRRHRRRGHLRRLRRK
jgi:hypothetical protein